ncbi:MAG: hypothetical protein ACK5Z2_10240 [Bacteroidota bacterium]|jgi:uncharacterized repeat protein (TIGR01451 family)
MTRLLLSLILLLFAFASLQAQNLTPTWTVPIQKGLGSLANTNITLDSQGNLYACMNFTDSVDVDPSAQQNFIRSAGGTDIFICKYSSAGSLIWGKSIGGPTLFETISEVKIDNQNNIYLFGKFADSIDTDPSQATSFLRATSPSLTNIFIVKLDSDGNQIYAKTLGSTTNNLNTVRASVFGNEVYVGGEFSGSFDVNPGIGSQILSSVGSSDIFLLKLNQSGNYCWSRQWGSTGFEVAQQLYGDTSLGLSFCIKSATSYNADPLNLVQANTFASTISMILLDTSGHYNNFINLSAGDITRVIGYDTAIYISQVFNISTDVDPGPSTITLIPNGGNDIVVKKISYTGQLIWYKQFGGSGFDECNGITVDPGKLILCGSYSSNFDFDPGVSVINHPFTANQGNGYLLCLDLSGNYIWSYPFNVNSMFLEFNNVFLDQANHLFLVSNRSSSIDIDPGQNTFLVNAPASGSAPVWVKYGLSNCANLAFVADTFLISTCASNGYVNGYGSGGTAPYSYVWNTLPPVYTSSLSIQDAGFYTVTVTDNNNCQQDYSIYVPGPASLSARDLTTHIVSSEFRPGFAASIWLGSFNTGCAAVSGPVKFVYDSLLQYITSSPLPDVISGDTLIWNYNNLTYSSSAFSATISFNVSTSAAIGDTVHLQSIIEPASGDSNPLDNFKDWYFPVVNGYDPNDKKVHPVGLCSEGYINDQQKLTYTIRFQNTGNSSAVNVVVKDSISQALDINTFRFIYASHDVIVEKSAGNIITFRFDSILLPDSLTSNVLSQGYFIFEISPVQTLSPGSQIENFAAIYFDFNPPIITNTVLNTIELLPINPTVTFNGQTLSALPSGYNYQWINCITQQPVAGATGQFFNPLIQGTYAVLVSDGCRTDTSSCVLVMITGNTETDSQASSYLLINNLLTVTGNSENYISIIDQLGRVLYSGLISNSKTIDMNQYPSGLYHLISDKHPPQKILIVNIN